MTILLMLALLLAPHNQVEAVERALHVSIARTIISLEAPDLAQTLDRLAWEESRWNPDAVSSRGACGLWQIIPRYWGGTCERYRTDPVFSARQAIRIVRTYQRRCGACWLTCYRYGANHPKSRRCKSRRLAASR